MVWHALMDVMVSMTSSMQCSWHNGVSSAPGGLHDCSAHLFLPLLPFLLTGFWSATHIYICFVLSVQSVETNKFFSDLYSSKYEYFFGRNHHLYSVGLCGSMHFFILNLFKFLYSVYTLWLCMCLELSIFCKNSNKLELCLHFGQIIVC